MNIKEEGEALVPRVERLLKECAHTEAELSIRLHCEVLPVCVAVRILRERGQITDVPRPLLHPLVWIQDKSGEVTR